jgi:CheY-like chemotaxis protein
MLSLGKRFLEMSGNLNVDTAISAKEALAKMTDRRYDAIVSDYLMPGMNGLEFLKYVRDRDRDIPFILFTGRGREDIAVEAYDAQVSCYLQKGSDTISMFVELEHRINQAVIKRETEESLRIKNLQATLAMDLAKIASWEYDEETDLFKFDDLFFSLCGTDIGHEGIYVFSPEMFVSKFIHPDDRERVMGWMQTGPKALGPEGYGQIEHRIVRRDGQMRKIIVRVGMMFQPDALKDIAYGVCRDITELDRTEEGINRITPL